MEDIKIGDIFYSSRIRDAEINFDIIHGEVILIRKENNEILFCINSSYSNQLAGYTEFKKEDIGNIIFRTRQEALLLLKTKILRAWGNIIVEIGKCGESKDEL